MEEKKICLTTFVFGEQYHQYIPFLIYSIKKSYPDYFVKIFTHKKLNEKVQKSLSLLEEKFDYEIVENSFQEIQIDSVFLGKSLRWLITCEMIGNYDYVYFIDIDILYCREPVSLHEQHIKHMKILDLPISNTFRFRIYENRHMRMIYNRWSKYGFKNALKAFIKGNDIERRLTGLHFVKKNEYFPYIKETQKKYKDIFCSGDYLEYFGGLDDEAVLYNICNESGFDLTKMEKYSDEKSLNYNSFDKKYFRPHHGMHLALFRNKMKNKVVIDSKIYENYTESIKSYFEDELFKELIENSGLFVRKQLSLMKGHYGLDV